MDTKRPKTEADLRYQAERRLDRKIPDIVWDWQRERGRVEETLELFQQGRSYDTTLRDFLDDVLPDLESYHKGREERGQRTREQQPEGDITEFEMERAKVVAEYLAKYLSAQSEIRNFREETLGGQLLSAEEADVFVSSPATCYADRFDFHRSGIPFAHHQATLIEEKLEIEQGKLYYVVTYLAEPHNPSIQPPFTSRYSAESGTFLDWVNEDLSSLQIRYCKGSLLDEIISLAASIVEKTGCLQQVAILFLLTGLAPLVQPVRIRANMQRYSGTYQYHQGSISMMIEPWVSAESVMKTYKRMQHYLLTRPNRPMTARDRRYSGIDVFRFVTQKMRIIPGKGKYWDDSVDLPSWAKLREEWNKVYPDRPYNSHWKFYRDYKRAEQLLLLPPFRTSK